METQPPQTTYAKDVVSSPTVNLINWAMVDCLVSMVLVSSKCFLWLVLCFSYYQVPTGQWRRSNEHNGVLVTEKQPLLDRLIEGQTFLLGKVFYHWIDGGMSSSKGVLAVQLVSTKSGLSGRWMGEWAPTLRLYCFQLFMPGTGIINAGNKW